MPVIAATATSSRAGRSVGDDRRAREAPCLTLRACPRVRHSCDAHERVAATSGGFAHQVDAFHRFHHQQKEKSDAARNQDIVPMKVSEVKKIPRRPPTQGNGKQPGCCGDHRP